MLGVEEKRKHLGGQRRCTGKAWGEFTAWGKAKMDGLVCVTAA